MPLAEPNRDQNRKQRKTHPTQVGRHLHPPDPQRHCALISSQLLPQPNSISEKKNHPRSLPIRSTVLLPHIERAGAALERLSVLASAATSSSELSLQENLHASLMVLLVHRVRIRLLQVLTLLHYVVIFSYSCSRPLFITYKCRSRSLPLQCKLSLFLARTFPASRKPGLTSSGLPCMCHFICPAGTTILHLSIDFFPSILFCFPCT